MLLGFYQQFEHPIITGTKIFTIRKRRKIKPRPGETLYMYTGGYNASRRLIYNKYKLVSEQNVRILIHRHPWMNTDQFATRITIIVEGRQLNFAQIKEFAVNDGFANVTEWCDYWLTGKNGKKKMRTDALMVIYHWTNFKY